MGQLVVNGLALGSIYALVALGIGLLFGILRLINFAHGDFITIGCYALIVPSSDVTARLLIGGWSWPAVIPAICLIVVIAALITDALVFRPLRRASSTSFRIATDAPPDCCASHSQCRGSSVTSRATTPSFGRPGPRVAGCSGPG